MSSPCPRPEVLHALATGATLPPSLMDHLARCDACRQSWDEIHANDAFLASAFAARPEPGAPAHGRRDPARDYALVEVIAHGGQGLVYRATHLPTQRTVAVKMLTGGTFSTPRQRARFEREIEIAASIRHPNVVTLYDAWTTPEGGTAYAMEFIEGRSIDQWAASLDEADGAMRTILDVFIHACEGVFAAHQRGIIHRDLKPSNIVVDQQGQPHILDFGVATRSDLACAALTMTNEFAGTLAYAAPEQVGAAARAGGGPDTRTDVYALGVVLYELLTGHRPHDEEGSIEELVDRICHAEPAPMRLRGSGRAAPEDVRVIVMKCLAKEPDRRYATARELGEELRRYLDGRAIHARRDSTLYVLRKLARRHRGPLVAALLAGAVLLAGGIVIQRQRAEAALARQKEALERLRAESDARTAQAAVRLLDDLLPDRTGSDVAAIGREAIARQGRAFTQVSSGLMAMDPQLGATGLLLFSALGHSPSTIHVSELALRQALPELHRRHGPRHLEVARANQELGAVLNFRHRPKEAESCLRRALDVRIELLGEDAEPVQQSRIELARTLRALSRDDEARSMIQAAIERLEGGGLEESLEMADALEVRADLRQKADPPAAARDALAAFSHRLVLLSDWHPDVSRSLRALAELARDPDAAPTLAPLRAALEVDAALLPDRLERLARDIPLAPDRNSGGFGELATDSDRTAAALRATAEMVALKHQFLGPDHASTARTLLLGAVYAANAQHAALALDLARQALANLERSLGPTHVAVATCWQLIGACLIDLEQFDPGVEAAQKVIAIWSAQPEGSVSPFAMVNMTRWQAMYTLLGGRLEEAERLYMQAEEGTLEHGQPGHYLVGVCRAGRGWAAARQGRLDEGERLIRDGITWLSFPVGDPRRDQWLWANYMLADVLIRQDRLEEAQSVLTPLVQEYVRDDVTSSVGWYMLEGMAEIAHRQGREPDAARLREQVAEFRARAQGRF